MLTSIRLPDDIGRRLDLLAKKTGRSKAYYLRELIARGIEDLEDYYLADSVMEGVRSGKSRLVSTEELDKELGLDG
jgi:RHH-type rel operon transcriptional repressor/antitoxin RelB